ncbi:MAG: hypothetical protein JOZ90_15955 [Alphaproteobacteria bacterium]|nr:hypothetical protein [Alphaproteobacteria bacterium]MBV9370597.1 hypothetical protein [Alphaproteobacteria bacterium]MBV9902569.1 hypothetical protein [Alphaproteobacteria bacterium]
MARAVDEVIARMDATFARYDGRTAEAVGAQRRYYGRALASAVRRLVGMGAAIALLAIATVAFGLVVGPIGWNGLFVVALLTLAIMVAFSLWPVEPKRVEYSEALPTPAIVRQLEGVLVRERRALPAPAARRVDAISAQLPLLESRLGAVDPLDPLAQDARRLMGKHLPELIERYERIPSAYRQQTDGEGLTADQRLVSSLEAAKDALDDIGARLAQSDRQAFETQGRFIETRYKDRDQISGG